MSTSSVERSLLQLLASITTSVVFAVVLIFLTTDTAPVQDLLNVEKEHLGLWELFQRGWNR